MEPQHDFKPRTTATSASEGRLKEGLSYRKKKRKILKNSLRNYIH